MGGRRRDEREGAGAQNAGKEPAQERGERGLREGSRFMQSRGGEEQRGREDFEHLLSG